MRPETPDQAAQQPATSSNTLALFIVSVMFVAFRARAWGLGQYTRASCTACKLRPSGRSFHYM